jgi:hypothetical protein
MSAVVIGRLPSLHAIQPKWRHQECQTTVSGFDRLSYCWSCTCSHITRLRHTSILRILQTVRTDYLVFSFNELFVTPSHP